MHYVGASRAMRIHCVYMRGSRNFLKCVCVWGGGGRGVGVQAQLTEKSDNVFCYFLFAYFTVGVQWFISRKTIIFQGSREDPTSFRGISLTIQSANDH